MSTIDHNRYLYNIDTSIVRAYVVPFVPLHKLSTKILVDNKSRRFFLMNTLHANNTSISKFCQFKSKSDYIIHTESRIGEELTIPEAIQFLKEYHKSQTKSSKEHCVTSYDLENMITKKRRLWLYESVYGDMENVASKYLDGLRYGIFIGTDGNAFVHRDTIWFKNIYKNNHQVLPARFNHDIFILADDIVSILATSKIRLTKNALMFSYDFTLAHERQHRTIAKEGNTVATYFNNHFNPVYNTTSYDIAEHCCDRAGLIYAVKQRRKRMMMNKDK